MDEKQRDTVSHLLVVPIIVAVGRFTSGAVVRYVRFIISSVSRGRSRLHACHTSNQFLDQWMDQTGAQLHEDSIERSAVC